MRLFLGVNLICLSMFYFKDKDKVPTNVLVDMLKIVVTKGLFIKNWVLYLAKEKAV